MLKPAVIVFINFKQKFYNIGDRAIFRLVNKSVIMETTQFAGVPGNNKLA